MLELLLKMPIMKQLWLIRISIFLYQNKISFPFLLLRLLLSRFSHVQLCDPRDGSPPGSPIPGILQARTLEWVAISFSNAWKWKVKVKSLSRIRLFATPWTAAYQAPPSMGFSRQEYLSGLLCPPLRDLPDPGIEPDSLMSPVLAGGFCTTSTTWEALWHYQLN